MIELEQAAWNTRKALGKFLPDARFVLTSFKPPLKDYETWVFRCKVKGKNESYVCKTARRNAVGRAKILNQFKRLETAFPVVNGPRLKVPEPLSFDHKFCTMIMEDAKGQSFLGKMPDFVMPSDAASFFKDAGRWLALFQSSTVRTVEFQPKPHTNWLRRAIKQHQENDRYIPDFENFIEAFGRFETLDTMARNLPAQRCVTHRDFHLGNVIFKQNGSVYGIDFENDREDVALRDVASLFLDFAY
jgi:Phosphotransferase enzyme family